MNIITDKLPETVTVCGVDCPIKTDYRVWIKFTQISLSDLPNPVKGLEVIKLIFITPPPNMTEGLRALMDFYNPRSDSSKRTNSQSRSKTFDFDYDGPCILAAFKQQYGIDLRNTDIHWYEFKALMDNLSDTTSFVKILQYRTVNLGEIKSDEMRKFYSEMKLLHALPDNRSKQQKNADFSNSFLSAFVSRRR